MIQPYEAMSVELLNSTKYPDEQVALALSITMNANPDKVPPRLSAKTAKFILDAEHTSVLEHVNYTFLISGISRSLLSQVTRQRMSSFTSGSQHYQKYMDYPAAVPKGFPERGMHFINLAKDGYVKLLEDGIPREEARQVLPMAMTTNLLWTINARSLMMFLRQRLCHRNVLEMRIFADKVLKLVEAHFPALFIYAGPQCFDYITNDTVVSKPCLQGKMSCGRPWTKHEF